jgi:predicted RNase H-like HicB family nuclease
MATSAKSRNSNNAEKALDRPFDKAILAKAKAIVEQYKIVLEFEDGDWYGHGLEMPTAYGDGKTVAAAVADTREGLITAVAYMLEKGQTPPEPAREGNRSAQVNVRLTPEEKVSLETRAKARGFRGLSDFIRASVLAEK